MADGKKFSLSIVLRSVDRATAGIRRVNEQIRGLTAPIRRLNNQLRAITHSAGLPQLVAGFRGVGSAAVGAAKGVGAIAVAAGLGVGGLTRLIDQGDKLAKTADRIGLSVDALAQLRFAASQSGVDVQLLDASMDQLSKRVGEAKVGTGALVTLLNRASPALLKQLQAAESNEEAFGLLADAISSLEDPQKRAALANAAFGRSGAPLINLLALGRDGVDALKKEYFELAGPQEEAARQMEKVQDAMGRVSAATTGVKAALLSGLAPAFLELADRLKTFFVENREQIGAWVRDFGEKLPGRVRKLVDGLKTLGKTIEPVWNAIGGVRGAAIGLSAILGGKLIFAIIALGRAMLTTPLGLLITGIAALIFAGKKLVDNWDVVKGFFANLWTRVRETFANFWGWVKNAFLNFTPLGRIIQHWEPIKEFFANLWDKVIGVFDRAWKSVKAITGKIVDLSPLGLMKRAIGAIGTVRDLGRRGTLALTGEPASQRRSLGLEPPPTAAALLAAQAAESRIKIDITGAPRGARAEIDPKSDAAVDLTLGYQMAF